MNNTILTSIVTVVYNRRKYSKRKDDDKTLDMNDICKVKLRTTKPLMIDSYRENRTTGSLILIDDATNETVAAGMVV